ncbi:5-formyltetrahydrofolate cyclo-ligase, mitochondrial-like [Vicia villosa]|uniref:5-formyltetrahydrofolate cyclo-ligase, mitochondrial-like n=1 Tax=Vicia villosa TaxID=3911 RepID=UPI00273BB9A9|nr:5-formyltetrahydrofolate cyclo-ligase, mitochondrial-like [Vicia villosa]
MLITLMQSRTKMNWTPFSNRSELSVLSSEKPSRPLTPPSDLNKDIILGAPWFKSSLRLCAYISCNALQEVDTFKLLSHILQPQPNGGKKLYVPRVEDKNSHMRMLNISRIDDLVANSMDILESAPVDADGSAREDGICLSFSFTAKLSYLTH